MLSLHTTSSGVLQCGPLHVMTCIPCKHRAEPDRVTCLQLYVAHLDPRASEEDVRQLFSAHGAVMHARIIQDRDTGQSKGYGFVTMGTPNMAQVGSASIVQQNICTLRSPAQSACAFTECS